MNGSRSHLFWGSFSPLGGFSGGGLLLMASSRLAWALSVSGALLWVYTLSALAACLSLRGAGEKIFPRRGRMPVIVSLACFSGGIYLLLLWFLSPLAAMEVFAPVSLVPLFCAASGLFRRVESLDLEEALPRAASEAAVIAGLLIAFALVREPLGFACLSLPGGAHGMTLLFSFKEGAFLPVRIIACSTGALLLLGYCAGIFRYFRTMHAPREADQ